MVYRHDGTDDHDTDEFEPEFDDDFAPNDPGPKPEPEIHQFEYPGPSAYDIALSENETPDLGDRRDGLQWLKSAGAVLLIFAALGLLIPLVGPLAFPGGGDSDSENIFRSVRVREVLDGNTIVVNLDGETETVRYIGVSVGVPGESFNRTASLANQSWVEGQIVILERDGDNRDREGRLLRYVYVNNEMVNAVLLAGGLARYQPHPYNNRHNSLLLSAEDAARDARRGIWTGNDAGRVSPA
jgi:micrococcal nuclease|tara:strand:+ start:10109 stop:10831 length:723 start_codon:yes stop_codon:yes gene_type:complete